MTDDGTMSHSSKLMIDNRFYSIGWKYSKGFVSEEMIKDNLYPPSDDTLTLMCGPPPMINYACQPNLEKLGYSAELRFAY